MSDRNKTSRNLYVGAITGTSVDGLDLSLLDLEDGVRFVTANTRALPPELRNRLLELGQPGNDDLDRLGEADRELGGFIGEAINRFLNEAGIEARSVRAIGSHGQTVRHRPSSSQPFTWQIGDPNMIAETTGITTVADFRRRDMAAGGQGAPLVPPFHKALFHSPSEQRVVVNIGGIANLTILPRNADEPVLGFDSGPGNGLMDGWCVRHNVGPFDRDGAWALSGKVDQQLLETMQSDAYFKAPPPKSTGREQFNLPWLESCVNIQVNTAGAEDVQRTLLELTVTTIVDAASRWAPPYDRLILCGGGASNPFLLDRMNELSAAPVDTTTDHGFDADFIEAGAFAWLAQRRLTGEAGNVASVTGAAGGRVLGGVYCP